MKILMLCGDIPYPPHDGSRIRVYQFIRTLSEQHDLTLLAYQYADAEYAAIHALEPFCHVEVVRWTEPARFAQMRSDRALTSALAHVRALWLDPDPLVAQYFRSRPMLTRLRDLLARERFDILHVEDTALMACVPANCDVPLVLSIQNVEHWREARARERGLAHASEVLKLRRFEGRAFARAAVCCPTSDIEAGQVRALHLQARVQVIPTGVDTCTFAPGHLLVAQPTMVFTGTLNYAPNMEGIVWFARDVLPLVRKAVPDARLDVVGRDPPEDVLRLASEQVCVIGEVADIVPYLQRAWLSIVPIHEGGGIRVKILEALACALPVVSTTRGAEGLRVTHGQNILIADDPASFAQHVVQLLRDPSQRAAVGHAGRMLVEQAYDRRSIALALESAYRMATRN